MAVTPSASRATPLPVADRWYAKREVAEGVTLITEPHAALLVQGNVWHIRGRDRDLVVDAGIGVARLRDELPELFENHPVLVVTHAHLDHMGCADEFDEVWAHPAEPMSDPLPQTLNGPDLVRVLGMDPVVLEGLVPDVLLEALPYASFDPARYRLRPVTITREIGAGDVVDLGDRRFNVLHLPGHTPGSIGLYDSDTGVLLSGDVVYDVGGVEYIMDGIVTGDIPAFVESMRSLAKLDVSQVFAGHGDPIGGSRMHELIDEYLTLRTGTDLRGGDDA